MKALLIGLVTLLAVSSSCAEHIGVFQRGGERLDFYSDPGPCVGRALRVEYTPENGRRVPGCWGSFVKDPENKVFIVFFDGAIAVIDRADIKAPDPL